MTLFSSPVKDSLDVGLLRAISPPAPLAAIPNLPPTLPSVAAASGNGIGSGAALTADMLNNSSTSSLLPPVNGGGGGDDGGRRSASPSPPSHHHLLPHLSIAQAAASAAAATLPPTLQIPAVTVSPVVNPVGSIVEFCSRYKLYQMYR